MNIAKHSSFEDKQTEGSRLRAWAVLCLLNDKVIWHLVVTNRTDKQKESLHAFFINKKQNEEKFMAPATDSTDDFRICHSLYCMQR